MAYDAFVCSMFSQYGLLVFLIKLSAGRVNCQAEYGTLLDISYSSINQNLFRDFSVLCTPNMKVFRISHVSKS